MTSYQMISFDFLTIINNIPIMWKTKVLYLMINGMSSFHLKENGDISDITFI